MYVRPYKMLFNTFHWLDKGISGHVIKMIVASPFYFSFFSDMLIVLKFIFFFVQFSSFFKVILYFSVALCSSIMVKRVLIKYQL